MTRYEFMQAAQAEAVRAGIVYNEMRLAGDFFRYQLIRERYPNRNIGIAVQNFDGSKGLVLVIGN